MTGRVLPKVLKVLSFGSALVLAILLVAHFAWKYSGSNKWELEINKNGVQVYALKSPGFTLKTIQGCYADENHVESRSCSNDGYQ